MSRSEFEVNQSGALEKRQAETVEPYQPPSVLEMIAQAARDPNVDVAKMRELLAMQKEIIGEERRIAYVEAMNRVQSKLPQFGKTARVIVKGTERSRYAPIEDIDAVLRPLCFEEGLSISDDVKSIDPKTILVVTKVSHKSGHFEEKTLPLPIDFSDFRSGSQSTVASVTLGKRHLRKMHFNIVERGEDTNGETLEPITDEQAKDLYAALEEVKGDKGMFLHYMGVPSIEKILKRDLQKATASIEAKRRKVSK